MRHLSRLGLAVAFTLAGCSVHSNTNSAARTNRDDTSQLARSVDAKAGQAQRDQFFPKVWNADHVPQHGQLELVATVDSPMLTGVTVSKAGRIFINFPKWGDKVDFTVAELKNGKPVPFPDANWNREDDNHPDQVLVAVQSVVVDPADRLWILDTGSKLFGPVAKGGAKLVCVDLKSNQVVKKIVFPQDVAKEKSYLNDVRFDLTRGSAGYAYITDSSTEGDNGIVVVDLDSGKSWRRLNNHPSTKGEQGFIPMVEGEKLLVRQPGQQAKAMTFGSDGIAISADGKRLFYCPLSSRKLYAVRTDALVDQSKSEEEVAKTVEDLGVKCASDGLETDSQNRVYATDYETAAIRRRNTDGTMEVVVQDPRLIWPDTMSLAADGYLYVTANQLDRMARFWDGKDKRVKPYGAIFRVKVDAQPIRLVK